MRVSDQQLFGSTAGSLTRIKEQIVRVHEQIATQQRIAKPSDDPTIFGAGRPREVRTGRQRAVD